VLPFPANKYHETFLKIIDVYSILQRFGHY